MGAQGQDTWNDLVSSDSAITFKSTPLNRNLISFFDTYPNMATEVDVVLFDDAHFFSEGIIHIARKLRLLGLEVLVCGLDLDCFQQPYGPMPHLMAMADEVVKSTAICVECYENAQTSFRVDTSNRDQELVGDKEYFPLCWDCWEARNEEKHSEDNF